MTEFVLEYREIREESHLELIKEQFTEIDSNEHLPNSSDGTEFSCQFDSEKDSRNRSEGSHTHSGSRANHDGLSLNHIVIFDFAEHSQLQQLVSYHCPHVGKGTDGTDVKVGQSPEKQGKPFHEKYAHL